MKMKHTSVSAIKSSPPDWEIGKRYLMQMPADENNIMYFPDAMSLWVTSLGERAVASVTCTENGVTRAIRIRYGDISGHYYFCVDGWNEFAIASKINGRTRFVELEYKGNTMFDVHVLLPTMKMYTGQICYEHQTSSKGINAAGPSIVHLRGQGPVDVNNQRDEQNYEGPKLGVETYPFEVIIKGYTRRQVTISKDFIAATKVKKHNSVMLVVPNYRKRTEPWEIFVAQSCTAGLRLSGGWSKFVSDMDISDGEKWLLSWNRDLSASTGLIYISAEYVGREQVNVGKRPAMQSIAEPHPDDGERKGKRHRVEESNNTKEVVEISSEVDSVSSPDSDWDNSVEF